MENSSSLATPIALPLTRTCFVDEQDRFNEYTRHTRLPVEAGLTIQGDPGQNATDEQVAEAVAAYIAANPLPAGPAPTQLKQVLPLTASITSFDVVGDLAGSVCQLYYLPNIDPATKIGILCYMFNTTTNATRVYFTAAIPDSSYLLIVSSWQ